MSSSSTSRGRSVLLQAASASVLLLGGATACSDAVATERPAGASLSFALSAPVSTIRGTGSLIGASTGAAVASADASATASSNIVITTTRTVDLQSVDVVFDDITFAGQRAEDVDDDPDDDVDDGGDCDCDGEHHDRDRDHAVRFRAGAATVGLPLEGGVITPFTGELPAGTYRQLSMKAQYVRLVGTVDGEPFDVTVPVNSRLLLAIDPPLVVTSESEPANVSVDIDVASWLLDSSGNVIDPRVLNTNAEARSAFSKRVRSSFRAFDDRDCDGK